MFAKGLDATDKRDLIYSWIGLATVLDIKVPRPNYNKPVDLVFQEARIALMEQHIDAGDVTTHASKTRRNIIVDKTSITGSNLRLPTRTQFSSPKLSSTPVDLLPVPLILQRLNSGTSDADTDSDESSVLHNDFDHKSVQYLSIKELIDDQKRLLLQVVLAAIACYKAGQDSPQDGTARKEKARRSDGSTESSKKKQKVHSLHAGASGTHERRGTNEQESDDDGLDSRPRKQPQKPGQQANPRNNFACPYFQRNPQHPRLHGACHGPGFSDLHRLKYDSPRFYTF